MEIPREKDRRPAWLLHLNQSWWVAGPDPESTCQIFLPVNQCLENPTDDDVSPAPETDDGATAGRGRVLLLDDDAAFETIIEDFLVENGFTVVAVQNGRDGIEAVMGGEFALVLCDMSMPTMPGDMFYRAVERIRPELCACFIFMTGYRGDASKSDFIKSINGYVLPKPFALKDLLDSIALTEVRRTFRSVFEAGETAPRPAHVSPPADPYLAKALLLRDPEGVAEELEPAPAAPPVQPTPPTPTAAVAPAPHLPTIADRVPVPVRRLPLAPLAFAVVGLALFLGLAATLDGRYRRTRDRAAAAATERLALEKEWKVVSPQLEQAEHARPGFASLPKLAKRIAEERTAAGWTNALRAASTNAGTEIEVRGVMAGGVEGSSGAWEIHLEGVAVGGVPRMIADRYCQALRRSLEEKFPAVVQTELERLKDEPEPSVGSGLRQASFAITVKIGWNQLPEGESGSAK